MKNYQKKIVFLILFELFLNIHPIQSQTSNDINTYNWFDTTVGKDNLDINNGVPHTNPYRTLKSDIYLYLVDKYESGKVIYEDQAYYDVKLKYDIYRDILVLNPAGGSENIGINLIQNKVRLFSILDKNFIKKERTNQDIPEFTSGYYEETKVAPELILYIKHHKEMQKTISDNIIYYIFKDKNSYYIDLKGKIYLIKSKSDLVKLFPEQKKQINGFYLLNRELRKSDLNQFMKNLMKYTFNSLSIPSK